MTSTRTRVASIAAVALAVSLAASANAANEWTGAVDAAWSNGANWSLTAEPVATDDVVLPVAPGGTINLSANEAASTLLVDGVYVLSGGSLNVANGVTVNGGLSLSGTTLSYGGALAGPVTVNTGATLKYNPATATVINALPAGATFNAGSRFGVGANVNFELASKAVLGNASLALGTGAEGLGGTVTLTSAFNPFDSTNQLVLAENNRFSVVTVAAPAGSTITIDGQNILTPLGARPQLRLAGGTAANPTTFDLRASSAYATRDVGTYGLQLDEYNTVIINTMPNAGSGSNANTAKNAGRLAFNGGVLKFIPTAGVGTGYAYSGLQVFANTDSEVYVESGANLVETGRNNNIIEGTLVKTGAGTFTISSISGAAAATGSGQVNVREGTLHLAHNLFSQSVLTNMLPTTNDFTLKVQGGATLSGTMDLNGPNGFNGNLAFNDENLAGPVTINVNSTYNGGSLGGSGDTSWNGTTLLNANWNVSRSSDSVATATSGATLVIADTKTLHVRGTGDFLGGVNVSSDNGAGGVTGTLKVTDNPNALAGTVKIGTLTLAGTQATTTTVDNGDGTTSTVDVAAKVGTLTLKQGSGVTSVVGTLSAIPTGNVGTVAAPVTGALGKLDVKDNLVAVQTGGIAPLAAAAADGQIVTTVADMQVVVIDGADLAGQTLRGYTFTASDALVGGTYGADANLDGEVNVGDLGVLASNWNATDRNWLSGDFNADTLVNVGDLGILASNWNKGATNTGLSFAEALALFPELQGVEIPEPASLGLLAIGALGLLRRRK